MSSAEKSTENVDSASLPFPSASSASSASRLIDRLTPPIEATESWTPYRIPVIVVVTSSLCVRLACFVLDVVEHHILDVAPSFTVLPSLTCAVVEMMTTIYLLDLISGIMHLFLDTCDVGPLLRNVIRQTKEEVLHFRDYDLRYESSGPWLQFIWNFQIHHAAPFPFHDDQISQLALLCGPLELVTIFEYYYTDLLTRREFRVWTTVLTLGIFVQTSHYWAHKRNRLGVESLPPLVAMLQDANFLLHPAEHRIHHEMLNMNFCIWNGWANPLLNFLFGIALEKGWIDCSRILKISNSQRARAKCGKSL